jgi:hypothetical protein
VPAGALTPEVATCTVDASAASICAFVISKYCPPLLVAIDFSPATSVDGGAIAIT